MAVQHVRDLYFPRRTEDGCSSANTLKIVRDILVTMYFISMGRWPHAKSAKLESALPKQGL